MTRRLGVMLQSVHVTVATPGQGRELGAPLPERDRPVLCAAIAARCQILVTGDRTHVGAFYGKTIASVRILSPRALAEALDL